MKAAEAAATETTSTEAATTKSAVQHASPSTTAFGSRGPSAAIAK